MKNKKLFWKIVTKYNLKFITFKRCLVHENKGQEWTWYSLSPSYSNVKINFKKVKIDSGINQISLISKISIYCKYVVF